MSGPSGTGIYTCRTVGTCNYLQLQSSCAACKADGSACADCTADTQCPSTACKNGLCQGGTCTQTNKPEGTQCLTEAQQQGYCTNGICTSCQNECTAGSQGCDGLIAWQCQQDVHGCLKKIAKETCSPSQVCTVNGGISGCMNCYASEEEAASSLTCGITAVVPICGASPTDVTGTYCSVPNSQCINGQCIIGCVDECVRSGTTLQCVNDELFLCEDNDNDGCVERTVVDHCLYGCDGNLCCVQDSNPNICGTPDGCGGTYPGDCPAGQHCALALVYACFGNCPDWCAPTFTPPVVEYRPVSECVEAIYHVITELVPSCSVPNVCERVPGPMTEEYQGDRLLNDEPCGAGLCKAGECVPECLSGPDVPGCRASQPRGAISATGACTGTQACYKCPQNTVWTGTECRDLGYEIRVDDVTVVAGQQTVVNPQTYDERSNPVSVMYYYTGFREEMTNMPLSIITEPDEVGVHSLTITARKVQAMDQTLSTRSIDIGVTCPANSQCCTEGATRWNEGASCTVVGGSRGSCGSDGVCRADGVLQQEGTAWNNCDDGLDNDRDGPYDCIKVNGRVETGCTEYCRGIFCDQGLAVCGEDCADLETDRSHCGTCSQACNENQVCEQAKCISKEGCFVACDRDSDCGTDRVCVNKGSCDANVTEPGTFTKCDGAWHLHERDGLSLPVRFAYFRDRTIKPMNRARGSGSYS